MNLCRLWPFGRRRRSGEAGLAIALDELAESVIRNERIDWKALRKRYPEHADELDRLSTAIGVLAEFGAPDRGP